MDHKCCLFVGNQLLLHDDGRQLELPLRSQVADKLLRGLTLTSVTSADGTQVLAAQLPESQVTPDSAQGWELSGLRDAYPLLPEADYIAAGKAWQIMFWDDHSRFCPRCAGHMVRHTDIMKRCPECGFEMYPVVSPAVIVRITRGDEILLVHARNFRGRFYGLVAGFVESGESLEECVRREVMEETGLTVTDLRYFGSQSWPYPSNIMVGFTAEYESGTIKLQDEELSAGNFFTRDNLPELPRKPSIARKLIDSWIAGEN